MIRVPAATLEAFAADVLRGMGTSEAVAEQVAASLTGADLRGHSSHGVIRLPWYAEMVAADALDPGAEPVVAWEQDAVAAVDGRSAFGQAAGRVAADLAASKAAERGTAAVGVRDATHVGRVGEWAERAAETGVVLAAFVNTQGGVTTVAPPGSADRRLSTNPMAFGVPTFDALPFPVVFDGATSQVAHGKITERAATGDPLPAAWTVDADGDPVTDAEAFEAGAGALRPLGGATAGYKGFGLAVVVELLAGVVGGGAVAGQRDHEWADNAAAFLAVDPTRFVSREGVEARVAALAAHLRETSFSPAVGTGPTAAGEEALLPGEAEYLTARRRRDDGVPLPSRTVADLRALAAEVEAPVPSAFE